jgi:colanic acid biosynthesis glycosyl transferase WcaI
LQNLNKDTPIPATVIETKRMKIIFLNRFFFPDHSATSQIVSDLAFALAERGHNVQVITSFLTYDGSKTLKRRESIRGVSVLRLPTSGFGRENLIGRAIDYVTFYVAAFVALISEVRHGDIVVAKTDPPMLSILSVPLAGLKGAFSVNWLQDIFPEIAAEFGMARTPLIKGLFLVLRRLRNASIRRARANIVLGDKMADKLRQMGVPKERIHIIPNWANGRTIVPVPPASNRLRQEWGLKEFFVIGYSGNLGRAHDIETFLGAIAALEEKAAARSFAPSMIGAHSDDAGGNDDAIGRNFCWVFIGGGAQMRTLQYEAKRRGFHSAIFKPYQARETLSDSLSLPDVHLISLRPELEGLIVPSKYYGIAAAGRPAIFIGDDDGEIARILTRSATGFAVREGDSGSLVSAILTLSGNPALAAAQGERAHRLFETKFDFPFALRAWEQLISSFRD